MSQDTRKDKRAKVVSLNVRYKSATVDEFIENHSHDVSKGGIFVKTPTPFPPGTLLKFEIRLAGDKSVISGVGRVVWKREPTQAGNERPAGMGVKFIKIDDQSRALIDKLTSEKPHAGSAYTSEVGAEEEPPSPAGHPSTLRGLVAAAPVSAEVPAVAHPVSVPPPKPSGTALPVPPLGKLPPLGKPPVMGAPAVSPPAPTSSSKAVGGAATAKPPVVTAPAGTGTLKGPPPPAVTARAQPAVTAAAIAASTAPSDKVIEKAAAVAPPSDRGSDKAPTSDKTLAVDKVSPPPPISSEGSKPNAPPRPQIPPPRKATIMGIGLPSTPPPAGSGSDAPPKEPTPAPPKAAEPMFPRLDPESGQGEVREPTVMKQAAELLEEALKEAGGSLDEIGQNPLFAKPGGISSGLTPEPGPPPSSGLGGQSGNTVVLGATPAPPSLSPSSPPPSVSPSAPPPGVSSIRGSSPSYDGAASQSGPQSMPGSQPLSAAVAPAQKKGGSAGLVIGLVAVVLLAGGGVYAWKAGLLPGGTAAPTAAPPPPANTTPTATPTVSAAPPPVNTASTSTDAGPTTTADAGAAASTDAGAAGAEKDAGKLVAEKPDKPKPPKPVWKPPVKPPPTTSSSGDNPDTTPTDTTPKDPAPTDVPKEAPKEAPKEPAPDPN